MNGRGSDRQAPALCLLAVFGASLACGSVPDDPVLRMSPPAGVIRGAVVYRGPRPCSRNGHIVGNAVLLVFDRQNPPPPRGLAGAPLNFTDVVGDVLFGNEPRYAGIETYCPQQHGFAETVSASAPFQIAPLSAGTYEIHAFFDYTGNFLPSFKIRDLPERGDIGGGLVAAGDVPAQAGANYTPAFLPLDVGVPRVGAEGPPLLVVPRLVIPPGGFVADDVTVTLDAPIQAPRPYFFPRGLSAAFDPASGSVSSTVVQSSDGPERDSTGLDGTQEADPNFAPVLTIPQDIEVLALPRVMSAASLGLLESSFPHLLLQWSVPSGEQAAAVGSPFNMQITPLEQAAVGGFSVWGDAALDAPTGRYVPQSIPEGSIPKLWPLVVLTKLVRDPTHRADPASLAAQGGAAEPVVVLQAITLVGARDPAAPDSLIETALSSGSLFDVSGRPNVRQQDHLTVLLRPTVLCFPALFDPLTVDKRGTLVTTHLLGTTADVDCTSGPCTPSGTADQVLVPPDLVAVPQLSSLVQGPPVQGCLPTGRFAISVVYPSGQAWTVPNEAGACAGSEGVTDYPNLSCSLKPRPVLYSQGNRAVVEIVAARDPKFCNAHPVPTACGGP